ncbi:MAG: DMT family transporter [Gammaproteobacteria bacterium]|nr:DMT family transporter [Gammaproteobacteria bacterium]
MSVPAAYIGVILIWSTTPLAIQWSSLGAGYAFASFSRMLLGAVLCLVLLRWSRRPLPWSRAAVHTYLAAGLGIYGSIITSYWASQYVPSGWISVMFGLAPLFTGVLAYFWLDERSLSAAKISGLFSGLTGLAVVFASGLHLSVQVAAGIAVLLVGVLIHSASMVAIKRIAAPITALAMTTGALLLSLPLFFLTWLLVESALPSHIDARALGSIVYLGAFGSVLGFVLYFYVVQHMAAASAALITLITPVFSLLLGRTLNGEPLTAQLLLGTAAILGGLGMHQWGDSALQRLHAQLKGVGK